MIEAARRTPREKPDGRLMSFLLSGPVSDGGQWDMVVNLIEKYGVMPKKCFPETHSSENSMKFNRLLRAKVGTRHKFVVGHLPDLLFLLNVASRVRTCFEQND